MTTKIHVVLAEGETDHSGLLQAFEDEQLAWEYLNTVASEWYPHDDLTIIEIPLIS